MAYTTTLARSIPCAAITLVALLIIASPLNAKSDEAPAPPLPGEVYFKAPEFSAPAISPDGRNIAFIAQSGGHACLFRLELKTGQVSGLFSAGKGEVDAFWWAGNERLLLSGQGRSGREYFVQELGSARPQSIDTLRNWDPDWIKILPNDPTHAVAYNKRFDLATGKYTLIENASADLTPVFSATGETRAKLWDETGRWYIAWRAKGTDSWQKITCSDEDQPTFIPIAMAPDDRGILVIANDQGDTQALMRLDPTTGRRTLIAQRPKYDINGLITTGPDHRPVGVRFCNVIADDILLFAEADQRFSAALDRSLPGMCHRVTSSSADGNLRVIEAWFPGYPARYYLFDNLQHRLSLLGDSRPDIPAGALGQVEVFHFKSRDGLEEFGHVLFPSAAHPGPVPLIVMAINGAGASPYSAGAFNPDDQFFASRGYAVAHIDVRGTSGFGRAYAKAGDFELGGKVVDDLEDGVRYLVHTGRVDSHRVALMGYDAGGIAALYTASVSKDFHAVVVYDADLELTSNSIKWLSTSKADTPTVVKEAGGTKAAYALVQRFEPESFLDGLSAPALLVYSTWFGREDRPLGRKIKAGLEHRHKPFEWYEIDFRDFEHVKGQVYAARYCIKAADYLDRTLK